MVFRGTLKDAGRAGSSFAKTSAGYQKDAEERRQEEEDKKRRQEAAKRAEEKKNQDTANNLLDNPLTQTIANLAKGANEAFLGGAIKDVVGLGSDVQRFFVPGTSDAENEKRKQDVLKSLGQTNEQGNFRASNENPENRNKTSFKIGQGIGTGEKIATDIASSVLPGAAAEKALRGTKALQNLEKSGKLNSVIADVLGSVGGGVASTGVGAVRDPNQFGEDLKSGNVAGNLALDAILGTAGGSLSALSRARKGAKAADDTVKALPEGTRRLPEGEKEIKQLTEPGERFYAPEREKIATQRADIEERMQRLQSNDLDYMRENGLTTINKDDGRLKKVMTENADKAKAQEEAVQAAAEAEQQVKHYNDIRISSPYHRQVDRIDAKKANELDQLEQVAAEQGADPQLVDSLKADIEARYQPEYDRLAQKYPQDAMEKPALDQAQEEATRAHMEAQSQVQQLADEQHNAYKMAAGELEAPDTAKLQAHQQDLQRQLDEANTRDQEITDNIFAAQERLRTPAKTETEANSKINDLQNGHYPPEAFNEDGSLNTKKVKQLWKDAQVERSQRIVTDANKKVENPTAKIDNSTKAVVAEDAGKALQVPKKSVNSFTQMLQTPTRLLRKIGLKDLSDTVEESFHGYRRGISKAGNTIKALQKETKLNKASKERVSNALNGDDIQLTPKEQKAVDGLRSMFKDYADRVGLPEERRIADYFPHMYENIGKRDDFVPIELDEIFQKGFNPKTRAGNIDKSRWTDDNAFIKDPFKVAAAYARQAERRIHMQPAFEEMNKYIKGGDVDHHTAEYLKSYGKYLKGDVQAVDKFVNQIADGVTGGKFGTESGTRALRGVRNTAYRANLQMNLSSAIRNLTQGTNTAAELGYTRTLQGGLKMAKTMAEAAKDAAKGVPNKTMQEMVDMDVFNDTFHQDGDVKMVKKFMDKFDKVGWAMFNATEKINRGTAYLGAKAKYLAKHPNATEEQARKYAADMVGKTQFHFNEMDTPPILRSQTAKAGLQYQSFNIKEAEYLADMLGGSKDEIVAFLKGNPQGAENIIKAMRWTGANLAMTAALGGVIGAKFTDMIPNPTDPRNYGSPTTQLLFGDGKGGAGIFDVISGKEVTKAYDEEGNEITDPVKVRENNLASFIQKTLPAIALPWGSQIKKTAEGLNTVDRGYSATDTGNIRFGVDQTDANRLQAGLFGQYALPEAQQFYGNNGQNISKSASDKVRQAPPGEEDQYLKFYTAANEINGRSKANKDITQLIRDGSVERAKRKAAEFNAKVDEAMGEFYSEYPDLDEDLIDELNSNMYINLTSRGIKQRAKYD